MESWAQPMGLSRAKFEASGLVERSRRRAAIERCADSTPRKLQPLSLRCGGVACKPCVEGLIS